ncbi:hypothetical protein PGT21_000544 [Puccinia graminis f. sp. tritici]|uniref:Uncharacterized protein n=1 Tax=Puccinia graminis f. sp. tritici TaxID=56615 RepID=A0A5B0P772_PUCGR|nr:hypothetical protein PGT21_000544 [Puccinia graminis f. sp. tritici]
MTLDTLPVQLWDPSWSQGWGSSRVDTTLILRSLNKSGRPRDDSGSGLEIRSSRASRDTPNLTLISTVRFAELPKSESGTEDTRSIQPKPWHPVRIKPEVSTSWFRNPNPAVWAGGCRASTDTPASSLPDG